MIAVIISSYDVCNNFQTYLCKYGYLNCDCTAYLRLASPRSDRDRTSRRDKRDLSVMIPIELDERQPNDPQETITVPNVLTTPSSQTCTGEHFRRGYQEYQLLYRLESTGRCDSRTMELMSKTRCGQPDIFDMEEVLAKESSVHDRTSDSRARRSRSVKEIIYDLQGTSVDMLSERRYQILKDYIAEQKELEHQTYNGGMSIRNTRSVLDIQAGEHSGFKSKKRISWRLMSSYVSPDLPVTVQNAILMHAFRYWSEVSPLCFEEKKTTPTVDIEIGFLEGKVQKTRPH